MARFVRNANSKDMGAEKAAIPEKKDAFCMNTCKIGVRYVTNETKDAQRQTTKTVGKTALAVGDFVQDKQCRL